MDTEYACPPQWGEDRYGGERALHPINPDTAVRLASVGGPSYTSTRAQPVNLPVLPRFLVQIRHLRAFKNHLNDAIYAVRPDVVVGRRRHVLSAVDLRSSTGLRQDQKLVLLGFGEDLDLERMSTPAALHQIAAAGYDLVVSPSYSFWQPRPRPDFLYSAKRSLHYFEALQVLGVPALLRVGWTTLEDARRIATWTLSNRAVRAVALDLQTYQGESFAEQIRGLALFDDLTGRRLHYLVNGPSTLSKYTSIYEVIPARRVCLTNAKAVATPPAKGTDGQTWSQRFLPSFLDCCRTHREMLDEAELLASER
jgi:hypothetical protein